MKEPVRRSRQRRGCRALLVLAVVLAASACGGGGGDGGPTAAILDVSDVEFQSLTLINEARSSEGLASLAGDEAAAEVARRHSEAMRDQGFFGHRNPGAGNGLRQRLTAAAVDFSVAAENLVQVHHGGNPAGVAHGELMASSTHRENILSERFTLVGVGVARQGDTFWITQIFLRP